MNLNVASILRSIIPPSFKNAWHHMQSLQAARVQHFPSRELVVIGVTGTDGKTTTTTMIYHILKEAGYPVGMISTIGARIGEEDFPTGLHETTPSGTALQRYLRQMVAGGMSYVVLEASSHGLRQGRLFATDIDIAVVTTITPEHLDEHGSFAQYRADKGKLFRALLERKKKIIVHAGSKTPIPVKKYAVLNHDDEGSFSYLDQYPYEHRLLYGIADNQDHDLWATDIVEKPTSISFILHSGEQLVEVNLPLIGRYNVHNALAAASVAWSQHIPLASIKSALESLPSIPGRMECITPPESPFAVVVDFASNANSLQQALTSLRAQADARNGRLVVVFGCNSERYDGKREPMGEIAGQLADIVIITSEDPRFENPEEIIHQVAAGTERAGKKKGQDYYTFVDRREAIAFALEHVAKPGDLVDITGKGHEQSMSIQGVEYPWDDKAVALEILGCSSD